MKIAKYVALLLILAVISMSCAGPAPPASSPANTPASPPPAEQPGEAEAPPPAIPAPEAPPPVVAEQLAPPPEPPPETSLEAVSEQATPEQLEQADETTSPATSTEGKYVASTQSDKYHYPDCRYAKNIKPENEVWFDCARDALNAGYQPCKVCNPPAKK